MQVLADRYRLVEPLGIGGMSVVWRGYDEVLGRQVAVKVLSGRRAMDDPSRDVIRAEARAAAKVTHPHLTNVFDYGEAPQLTGPPVPFVVMELVDGPTLAEILANGPLPWRTAARIGAEMAAGLAAAHARGLVHRDVKPANVMLTASGVKVVDFGIAAVVGELPEGNRSDLFGTPAYIAPERLRGSAVTPATDVYGVGLILYRALSGTLPWRVETTSEMMAAHCLVVPAPLPPVDGLPPEVTDLCHRCLSKDPDKRPSSADVAQVLAAAAGIAMAIDFDIDAPAVDESGSAQPRSARANLPVPARSAVSLVRPAQPRRPSRASRVRAGAVAAGVVAATLAAVSYQGRSSHRDEPNAIAEGPQSGGGFAPACDVRYLTRHDSLGAFAVELTITNTRDQPVDGWTLTFGFPGDQRVVRAAGGNWTQSGRAVTVRPGAGQERLLPRAATLVTIAGTYRQSNLPPNVFSLDGAPCTSQIANVTTADAAEHSGPPPVQSQAAANPPRANRTGGPTVQTGTSTPPASPGTNGGGNDNGSGSGNGGGNGQGNGNGNGNSQGNGNGHGNGNGNGNGQGNGNGNGKGH